MDYPKSTPSVGLVNGRFVDENPVNGSPGSLIPAVWGNAVTEELLNVVQAGGLEPAEAEHDQLLKAIRTIIQSSLPPEQIRTTLAAYGITDAYTKTEVEALFKNATALPVGAMMAFPKGVVPNGFLEVDGSVQSIATYPDLAAYLGTTFNKGDEGAGNFRLPESRGEFLRGWDHGRGVDAGRGLGTYQLDAFQGHYHDITSSPAGGDAASGTAVNTLQGSDGVVMPGEKVTSPKTDGVNGSPRTSSETRPRNLSVMWCIKAWNAPVNQGQIDVGALVDEVQKLKASVPIGSMLSFPRGVVPPGYLEADGSLQSSASYPDLAAYLGSTFNRGDEPTGYFRLPESRGEFLRGWDHGRGVDSGRTIGSWQNFDIQSHDHAQNGVNNLPSNQGTGGLNAFGRGVVGVATEKTGGVETRPRNIAVMWCIKAWNSPVNQGNIDVAALSAQVQSVQKIAVTGTHKGLSLSASGLSSLVSIAADQLVVSNDAASKTLSAVTLSINTAVVGTNGLDSGALAASTWYSVWVIWNGTTTSGLVSLSATNPALPSGYTHKALVGWIFTDATANKYPLGFIQKGRKSKWVVSSGSNLSALRIPVSGVAGTWSATAPVWAAVSLTNFVPPTAISVSLSAIASYNGGAQSNVYVAPSSSYLGSRSNCVPPLSTTLAGGTGSAPDVISGEIFLESMNIYVVSQTAAGAVAVLGWENNL
ncbi:phage-related tail fiber protein [Pseudomonas asplenii]|uniref:Phage-related tail fiber protein n=1 Tax=Pseudomonas asplenii TaxID=53407 RepID=A0A0N0E5P3_9PSED|nr:phage tail protein [Pseudomonas fuscovaginae]KPA92709.1 phage-related tail fiber protein [Pseudomonas fuscovaginae]